MHLIEFNEIFVFDYLIHNTDGDHIIIISCVRRTVVGREARGVVHLLRHGRHVFRLVAVFGRGVVPLQHVENGLRIPLLLLLADVGRLQQFGPRFRHALNQNRTKTDSKTEQFSVALVDWHGRTLS